MSIADFFINRPVFAWVIAFLIMISGILSIKKLPIEHYPSLGSATVLINARYPGASATTVENSVTQVLEQKLSGIDGLRYFSASSADSGSTISLIFETNTNADIAQILMALR